jgi:hypothetical protein
VQDRKRGPGIASAVLLVTIILVGGGSFWGWRYWRLRVAEQNELSAMACLKVLAVSQADFRANDRDNNSISDFWTADVASLYSLVPAGGGGPIQLIERALAEADGAGASRPYRGYLFRAMEMDEEGKPYRKPDPFRPGLKPARNITKFAFCAYPAVYGRTGRHTFIINEGNTILTTDAEGQPVLRFPTDPELRQSYWKPD